jgi:hypothetical protein
MWLGLGLKPILDIEINPTTTPPSFSHVAYESNSRTMAVVPDVVAELMKSGTRGIMFPGLGGEEQGGSP